jgi:hypothetical protein
MNHADVKQGIELNAKFIEEIGEPIYIIADYSQVQTSFTEILRIVQEAQKNTVSNIYDEDIAMLILVGNDQNIKTYHNTMQARGAVFGIARFDTLDAALEAAVIQCKMGAN